MTRTATTTSCTATSISYGGMAFHTHQADTDMPQRTTAIEAILHLQFLHRQRYAHTIQATHRQVAHRIRVIGQALRISIRTLTALQGIGDQAGHTNG